MSDDRIAWANTRILAVAQALGGANPAIVVSLGGLVGEALAPDPRLATLPVSLLQLGLAAGTVPASLAMRRYGRRGGYLLGATIGVVAGSIAATAIALASFGLFCFGTFLAGFYSAYVMSYRFAATDAASPAFAPRAISWVMAGGIAGAVIGPQTVIWTRDVLPGAPLGGGFLGQAALALVSIAVLALLRPTPVPSRAETGTGRPLRAIVAQPRFLLAVTAGLVSYGSMSFVMTGAPVAMVVECGHPVGAATLGIQWHILAMYGPSFVTGRVIARFGKERVVTAGLLLVAVAAAIGLSGTTIVHFWAMLVVLGLGWNLGFVGATSMLTECYRAEERLKTQAVNDFLVFGCVAIASFSSGSLLSAGGWALLNEVVLPVVCVTAAAVVVGGRRWAAAPAR